MKKVTACLVLLCCVFYFEISGICTLHAVAVVTCPSEECYVVHRDSAVPRMLTTDLHWKLSEVSRIVLILVVDNVPVGVVRFNALRKHKGIQGNTKHPLHTVDL